MNVTTDFSFAQNSMLLYSEFSLASVNFVYLFEAMRIFRRSLHVRRHGFKRYPGTASAICKQIVQNCWNGTFFQTSTGHFNQFWTRDFGWCTQSLLALGYTKEVTATLDYALARFIKHDAITTTITPGGKPFDFPTFGIDSLAFLYNSLALVKNKELTEKYRPFLQQQLHAVSPLLEPTGLVKKNIHVSSMKDHAIRQSSCYDTCMLGLLSRAAKKLALENPLKQFDYPQLLLDNYWTGNAFCDDLSDKNIISGDATILPLWTGMIRSPKIARAALTGARLADLTSPFPLKYTAHIPNSPEVLASLFVPGYEHDTIWAHLGMMYLHVAKKYDRTAFRSARAAYARTIEQHGTFLEVYNPDGTLFSKPTYIADEGMLWASIFATL